MLHRSFDLTELNVVWAPEMGVNPHNHCMWAEIGVHGGTEDNTFFRRDGAGFQEAGGNRLRSGTR